MPGARIKVADVACVEGEKWGEERELKMPSVFEGIYQLLSQLIPEVERELGGRRLT